MAKGSFLFVILDPAEEEASGRSCPRGPSVHSSSVGAWAVPGGAGGTQGLGANVALLRGESRALEGCLELLVHSECKSCPWNVLTQRGHKL